MVVKAEADVTETIVLVLIVRPLFYQHIGNDIIMLKSSNRINIATYILLYQSMTIIHIKDQQENGDSLAHSLFLHLQIYVLFIETYVFQQIVHLYLIPIYLQKQVNISMQLRTTFEFHYSNILLVNFHSCITISHETYQREPKDLVLILYYLFVSTYYILNQALLPLKFFKFLLLLGDCLQLDLKLFLKSLLLTHLRRITFDVLTQVSIITNNFLALFPEETSSNKNIQGIIHPTLHIMLILTLVTDTLVHRYVIYQSVCHFLVFGYGELRNDHINIFRKIFEALCVFSASVRTAFLGRFWA